MGVRDYKMKGQNPFLNEPWVIGRTIDHLLLAPDGSGGLADTRINTAVPFLLLHGIQNTWGVADWDQSYMTAERYSYIGTGEQGATDLEDQQTLEQKIRSFGDMVISSLKGGLSNVSDGSSDQTVLAVNELVEKVEESVGGLYNPFLAEGAQSMEDWVNNFYSQLQSDPKKRRQGEVRCWLTAYELTLGKLQQEFKGKKLTTGIYIGLAEMLLERLRLCFGGTTHELKRNLSYLPNGTTVSNLQVCGRFLHNMVDSAVDNLLQTQDSSGARRLWSLVYEDSRLSSFRVEMGLSTLEGSETPFAQKLVSIYPIFGKPAG